jgi:hypothetical protein
VTLDAESRLNLELDEPEVVALLAEHGGRLDRDDRLDGDGGDAGVYWLTMRPRSHPAELYYVRMEWDAYPYQPASIKFADRIRGSLTVTSSWPVMTGYRAASFDICRPLSKEGYAIHAEWNDGSTTWPTDGNPFLWVVQTIQFHMDNDYQGRAQ